MPVGEITSSVCFFLSFVFSLFFFPKILVMMVEQNATTYLMTCMKRMKNGLSTVYLVGDNIAALFCSYPFYSEFYAYSLPLR